MKVLFVNAAFRDGSRTLRLAEHYLNTFHVNDEVERLELGEDVPMPLDRTRLREYNEAVARHAFTGDIFAYARQFAKADAVVIAAPFWNFGLPAVLSAYLELVCSQGVSFDIDGEGNYHSLCRAKKLVFCTTAGGSIPEVNCAFGFIRQLCSSFFGIEDVRCYSAEALDVIGTDVEAALSAACAGMETEPI